MLQTCADMLLWSFSYSDMDTSNRDQVWLLLTGRWESCSQKFYKCCTVSCVVIELDPQSSFPTHTHTERGLPVISGQSNKSLFIVVKSLKTQNDVWEFIWEKGLGLMTCSVDACSGSNTFSPQIWRIMMIVTILILHKITVINDLIRNSCNMLSCQKVDSNAAFSRYSKLFRQNPIEIVLQSPRRTQQDFFILLLVRMCKIMVPLIDIDTYWYSLSAGFCFFSLNKTWRS